MTHKNIAKNEMEHTTSQVVENSEFQNSWQNNGKQLGQEIWTTLQSITDKSDPQNIWEQIGTAIFKHFASQEMLLTPSLLSALKKISLEDKGK